MTKRAPRTEIPADRRILVADRDAAELLGYGVSTFHRGVSAGDLPQPVALPHCRSKRWRVADLRKFAEDLD